MISLIRTIAQNLLPDFKSRKLSYAQYGEDLIIRSLFIEHLQLLNPTYLDLGAHHPFHLSNTALFHKLGSRGVTVEANPDLYQNFVKYRKKDQNLNIGVGTQDGVILPFYIMEQSELNTFVKETAEALDQKGYPIRKVVEVECFTLSTIVDQFCNGIFPDFLSIDVEGLDEAILETYDFSVKRPKVVCVENLQQDNEGKFYKRQGIRKSLNDAGYVLVADTFINDIFIDRKYLNY